MTGEQRPTFVPPQWSNALLATMQAETAGWRAVRELARQDDERLRREHPWRWRWAHARARAWRLRRSASRIVPVRWVGFGHDWTEWGDDA